MQVFLASIPLQGRAVVVVGSGEMALPKVRLLSKTPAELRWFAPSLAGAAPADLPAPTLRWPEPSDFADVALAFIAVAPHEDARGEEAARAAREAGAWVNVVDQPKRSDFQTPALVDRGDVVVAVATGGVAPVMARDLRARVEAALPPSTRALAALAREVRPAVVASPLDGLQRRRFWEAALRGEPARRIEAGDLEGARAAMARLLAQGGVAPVGVVHVVGAGSGDPELMTLKALRLLQDADVVAPAASVPPAIADYARRDAGRQEDADGETLEALAARLAAAAGEGRRVVRLVLGDGADGEGLVAALSALGIEAHAVRGVGFKPPESEHQSRGRLRP